ncbi:hypothetical protein ACS127_13345 [Amphibacillus sp. Q70]|uniref:hypothetical protein n=1 Tax=Amphibacillus sp. Q70 TaxID=3453416 RepID=UPI003F86B2FA
MAFGLKRNELKKWQQKVLAGEIAFITHYWLDDRFPDCTSVTKVGCNNLAKLITWGTKYDLKPEWIDRRSEYPHFDLFAPLQAEILQAEGITDQIDRFQLK